MNSNKKVILTTKKYWLPFAAVIVIFSGLVYAAVQQNFRMSANDPQIQAVEDIVNAITSGNASADSIVTSNPTTDIASSLSTFAAVYSATGTPIGSSVALGGKLPTLPSRVFDFAKKHGQDRFTWQPSPGVRIAAVVGAFSGKDPGFILVGRSLREVEIRENQLLLMSGSAGIVALVVTFAIILLLVWQNEKNGPKNGNVVVEEDIIEITKI